MINGNRELHKNGSIHVPQFIERVGVTPIGDRLSNMIPISHKRKLIESPGMQKHKV